MKESNQSEIVLPDAPVKAFKILLKYVYTGHVFLMTLKEDVILDTLGLAHQYGFQDLETAISDILKQLLALRNVCPILDTAHLYGLDKLVEVCHTFLDRHASEILTHESFLQLSQVIPQIFHFPHTDRTLPGFVGGAFAPRLFFRA